MERKKSQYEKGKVWIDKKTRKVEEKFDKKYENGARNEESKDDSIDGIERNRKGTEKNSLKFWGKEKIVA